MRTKFTPRVLIGGFIDVIDIESTKFFGKTYYERLEVGTDDWYAWLNSKHGTSFSFQSITFSRETRPRSKNYFWTATKRHGKKIHRVYVGKSLALDYKKLCESVSKMNTKIKCCVTIAAN